MSSERHTSRKKQKPAWMVEPTASEMPDETEATAKREPARMARCAKYGFLLGWAVAMYYMQSNTPESLGFYAGSVPLTLVFVICMGGGALAGAGLSWIESRLFPEDGLRP